MQMDSSASRTGSDPASACEWATTVRMPISRQVRRMRSAISPRLAMRILWNMAFSALLAGLHEEERLAALDGLGVLDEDLQDAARHLGLDLVHELHRLDDAEGLPLLDRVALADEWCRLGARGPVEGADHGRLDRHGAGGGFGGVLGAFRLGQRGGGGGGGGPAPGAAGAGAATVGGCRRTTRTRRPALSTSSSARSWAIARSTTCFGVHCCPAAGRGARLLPARRPARPPRAGRALLAGHRPSRPPRRGPGTRRSGCPPSRCPPR